MKILHYMFGLPPVRGGGLVRYALDLITQQMEMGEDAYLLIPGVLPQNAGRQVKIIKSREKIGKIQIYSIYNPLPVPMCSGILEIDAYTRKCDGQIYKEFLLQIRPDVIHIHTLMGLHQEFLAEAQILKIPMVFTTHDYFGICPAADMMYADRICGDLAWKQCELCCQNAYSMKRARIEQSKRYRFYRKKRWMIQLVHKGIFKHCFQKMRAPEIADVCDADSLRGGNLKDYSELKKYYEIMFEKISWFHFNSTLAEKIYCMRLKNIRGTVVSISHAAVSDHRRIRQYGKKLRLGYFGNWAKHKGFFLLLDVCRKMQEEGCRDLELHLYSDTKQKNDVFVKSHKKYRMEQLADVFDSIDLLIVPSIWPESFGFVVLEALSYGVPVIVSENVGAGDLLKAGSGCGFWYDGTAEGLKNVLKKIYKDRRLLEEMNRCIQKMDYLFSYEAHVKKILSLYQECIRRNI